MESRQRRSTRKLAPKERSPITSPVNPHHNSLLRVARLRLRPHIERQAVFGHRVAVLLDVVDDGHSLRSSEVRDAGIGHGPGGYICRAVSVSEGG